MRYLRLLGIGVLFLSGCAKSPELEFKSFFESAVQRVHAISESPSKIKNETGETVRKTVLFSKASCEYDVIKTDSLKTPIEAKVLVSIPYVIIDGKKEETSKYIHLFSFSYDGNKWSSCDDECLSHRSMEVSDRQNEEILRTTRIMGKDAGEKYKTELENICRFANEASLLCEGHLRLLRDCFDVSSSK